ncbi:MAG: transglutaminase family protein [Sphingomonas sp.]|jgi:transglutaminase-like putative cysteine protease
MRLAINHATRYRFSQPQARLVQLLRMRPSDTTHQTVSDWRIDLDCDARLRYGHDGFGNCTAMLYAEGPIGSIEIAMSCVVLTVPGDGVLAGVAEPLPPRLFLRATPLTGASEAIVRLAGELAPAGLPLFQRLSALCAALPERLVVESGRPVSGQSGAQALGSGRGTARDFAHIFIAAAHVMGVPARYVSGYSLDGKSGTTALHPTPNAWVEAYVADKGWVAFDPAQGGLATRGYVRVAIGLDAGSAAPVAGSRLGDGEEVLDAGVLVAQIAR